MWCFLLYSENPVGVKQITTLWILSFKRDPSSPVSGSSLFVRLAVIHPHAQSQPAANSLLSKIHLLWQREEIKMKSWGWIACLWRLLRSWKYSIQQEATSWEDVWPSYWHWRSYPFFSLDVQEHRKIKRLYVQSAVPFFQQRKVSMSLKGCEHILLHVIRWEKRMGLLRSPHKYKDKSSQMGNKNQQ